nr:hypothetical protein [uncultured Treponema sp.]
MAWQHGKQNDDFFQSHSSQVMLSTGSLSPVKFEGFFTWNFPPLFLSNFKLCHVKRSKCNEMLSLIIAAPVFTFFIFFETYARVDSNGKHDRKSACN